MKAVFLALSLLVSSSSKLFCEKPPNLSDVAFEERAFGNDQVALSPNGDYFCYSLLDPSEITEDVWRFEPGKTPRLFMGSHLYLQRLGEETELELVPGCNSWGPAISPDGSRVAFFSNAGGEVHPWVYEIASGRSYQVGDFLGAFLWNGFSPQWDSSGKYLYFSIPTHLPTSPQIPSQSESSAILSLSTDTEGQQTELSMQGIKSLWNGRLAKIEVSSGQLEYLTSDESSCSAIAMKEAYSGRYVASLGFSDKHPGSTTESLVDLTILDREQGKRFPIDQEIPISFGQELCSWHPTKNLFAYQKRGKLSLCTFSEDEGSYTKSEYTPEHGEHFFGSPFLLPKGSNYLISGINPKKQQYHDRPSAISFIHLEGGKNQTLSWEGTKMFREAVWDDVGHCLIVLLTNTYSNDAEIISYCPSEESLHSVWSGQAHIEKLQCRDGKLLAQMESLITPPDLYIWKEERGEWESMTKINPSLSQIAAPTLETFETLVPLQDGNFKTVKTAIILPAGAKKGDKLPGIVHIYPGANLSLGGSMRFCGGEIGTIPNYLFLERGYAIILPDYPQEFKKEGGHPIDTMVDALLPQIYHASELGYVDLQRVGIMGQSYGGYGTAAVISRTHLFRAAVAVSGIYDLPGSWGYIDEKTKSFTSRYWTEQGQGQMGSHPWQEFLRYTRNSPYYLADNITTPLLLVHGKNDTTCEVQEAEKMFTALMRLDKKAKLLVYPGGHVISSWPPKEAREASSEILDYFDKYLSKD